MPVRKVTCQLLDAIDCGQISADTVVRLCLDYMSEAQVADMCAAEGLLDDEDEELDDFEDHDEGALIDEW
jgi:hypothetical protein